MDEQLIDEAPADTDTGAAGKPVWHARPATEVLTAFATSHAGLDEREAARRLDAHGPNRLPEPPAEGWPIRLLRQFHNLFIYLLLGAALVSAVLGERLDAGVILGVVLINAVIGFIQEGRAERALDAIRHMIAPTASVLRGGRRRTIPAEHLVPGDLVVLEAGDKVPADVRLAQARNLKIAEAALTGESLPVDKQDDPVPAETALADRVSMAFSGTSVATGEGHGIVVATGAATELGRVSRLMAAVETLATPLIRQVQQLARQLTIAILGVSVLAFGFAVLVRDYALVQAFMAVVGLAVAAVPEGLPAVMSVTLAIGVQRMAARNAIIRRMPAVETLGAVSVICTDKTGTLTRNEMTARTLVTAAGRWTVSGTGYDPSGEIVADDDATGTPLPFDLIETGALCNGAALHRTDDGWNAEGDPLEAALLALAAKAGLDPAVLQQTRPRIALIPFDSVTRFMATLNPSAAADTASGDAAAALIKGAPEAVLAMCCATATPAGVEPIDMPGWLAAADELARRGERVLAFAMKPMPADGAVLEPAALASGAVLLGLVGFIDPPREEARQAIAECHGAGIRVIMITGDHAATAAEIARQLGIADAPQVMTGVELDQIDDGTLAAALDHVTVFARATPEQKLRLVGALQAKHLTVAMTGDGVNDAPALKRADVGVAMGQRGTEAAKEAAAIVLADDNFATIVAAVREGRTVYDNLMKVVAWTLPTSSGEALTILFALAAGLSLPITPLQILWVNMVTVVALGLPLAFEPTLTAAMRRPPRPSGQPILTGDLLWRVGFVSVLFVAGAFGVFFWAEGTGLGTQAARTMVVNTLVAMEIAYLFSVRAGRDAAFVRAAFVPNRPVVFGVTAVLAAQAAFTYLPIMQTLFETRPLGPPELAVIAAVTVLLFLVVECEKALRALLIGRPSPAHAAQPSRSS